MEIIEENEDNNEEDENKNHENRISDAKASSCLNTKYNFIFIYSISFNSPKYSFENIF